jgi:pyruvate dehydrogenase E2 component (dihydrolipoamide acetyltransferase)
LVFARNELAMVTGRATMATEVKLPRLGQGMESGTIVRWLKAVGETVEKGEPLYELDTEKVTQEVEAEASGVLLEIAVAEGEVEVGDRDVADSRLPLVELHDARRLRPQLGGSLPARVVLEEAHGNERRDDGRQHDAEEEQRRQPEAQ